jgi:hypothetical protein
MKPTLLLVISDNPLPLLVAIDDAIEDGQVQSY